MNETENVGSLDVFDYIGNSIKKLSDAIYGFAKWYQNIMPLLDRYIQIFANIGKIFSTIDLLIDNQIVFTDDLTAELINELYNSNNVESVIQDYYFSDNDNKMKALILRCQNAEIIQNYNQLYTQTIAAYEMGFYQLSCAGLLTILDGILSDITIIDTNYKKRFACIEEKINNNVKLEDIDIKFLCVYKSIDSFDMSILSNSKLSNNEPTMLNRHWILHGRTHRPYSRMDVLKVLLWIDAMIYIDKECSDKQNTQEGI